MSLLIHRNGRSSKEKVSLFRERFTGLAHIYGTYDPRSERAWQVKRPVTDRVILDHLTGRRPYGVYLLTGGHTRAIVADFDSPDATFPMDFVNAAGHYGISAYIEISKRKGFHGWSFAGQDGVDAAKARAVFRHILEEIGHPQTEIFPKQDAIAPDSTSCGNFINAPLYAPAVARGRTVFADPKSGMTPYPNQWDFLDGVELISESMLDAIIEINEIALGNGIGRGTPACLGTFQLSRAMSPCALRMLEEGVSAYQRVVCFRLAVQLRKAGLPFGLATAALTEWSRRNTPQDGKGVITASEVMAQTAGAYLNEYRGCGCEDPAVIPFCDQSCPVFELRGVMPKEDAPR